MIIDRVNLFDDVFLTRAGLVVTDGAGMGTLDDDWTVLTERNVPAAAHWLALAWRLGIQLEEAVHVPDEVLELARQIHAAGVPR